MKKYNLMMSDPVVGFAKNALINLPVPTSISLLWNKGFMMSMTLVLQIITGLFLSMNYVPSTEMAFDSVIHIMRDIDSGWMMRYLHMNGASLFFILMYVHILRGMYYNSPMKFPMVWGSGIILLLATMGAAFMGYVLPWGQMSFWGATVITSMISAIPYVGKEVTQWLWGNFSVSQPTLNRFFSLHFLIPLVIVALVLIHLMLLHKTGSSNPMGTNTDYDKLKMYKTYLVKDVTYFVVLMVMLVTLCLMDPNLLGDVENFNTASITTTPAHIQPEWYFLFAYAILRSIPSKLGGVLAMMAAIVIIAVLTLKKSSKNNKFNPVKKLMFWVFLVTATLLTWIGANPVEPPFSEIGQVLTTIYFTVVVML
nr:cytochrome b [Tyrophagus putrescentiae]